jgi:hypothetical protein
MDVKVPRFVAGLGARVLERVDDMADNHVRAASLESKWTSKVRDGEEGLIQLVQRKRS